jgi:hypothetical protein
MRVPLVNLDDGSGKDVEVEADNKGEAVTQALEQVDGNWAVSSTFHDDAE